MSRGVSNGGLMHREPDADGYHLIFRMWFRHPVSKKIIRTGRPIPMWVKD